jgi:hypothetical protein
MAKIKDVAKYVKSKNAGPFWTTLEIYCENHEDYQAISSSKQLTKETVARLYDTEAEAVKMFYLENLNVIKISYPRKKPQGHKYERDMHSGQQYVLIADVEI